MSASKKQPKGEPKTEPKPGAAKRAPPHLHVLNEQDSPHDISYVDARPCNCRSPWCSRCYKKLYYPKIVAELKKFNYRNTLSLTCTFDPSICPVDKFARENGKIPYPFLIEKAPLSRLSDAMKRSKQKPRLEVIRYIGFLEFNRNGNPHYHLLIEFTNGAFRKHDLQKFWKFGRLHVRAFESRDDYLDLFPYLLKDPRRYPESAYQTSPPQDWLASHPKIIRNPTSRNIRLGTDRSGRKRSPAKEKAVDETQENRQSYHKGLKACGKSTSICITLKSGKRSWLKLPIPYEEAVALAGRYRDDKAYQFNEPAAIEKLLKLSMRRKAKKGENNE